MRLGMSTAYHPHTDIIVGQTERMNRTLEDMLKHYVGPDHDAWEELLSSCEFAVKNAYQDSISIAPFLLNCKQDPRVAALSFPKVRNCLSAEKMTVQMQQDLQAAKQCLKRAQQRQKECANNHRRDMEFDVRDKVYLSTKNIKLSLRYTITKSLM